MTAAPPLIRLIQILAAVSGRPAEHITANTPLAELGLDSLDRVVLATHIEQSYAVTLPDAVLARATRVGDLLAAATDAAADGVADKGRALTGHRDGAWVHHTAEVGPAALLGGRTRVWHQAQVADGARIGEDCTIGKGVYIGAGSVLGDRVKVQNGCGVFGGRLEDETMLAPGVYLLEDPAPRAATPDGRVKTAADWQRRPVTVRRGATIGANATIAPGVTVGRYALVAIGSVVHRDVPDHALMAGNPARQVGWVCACGHRVDEDLACGCGNRYQTSPDGLTPMCPRQQTAAR
jgi:UDP-2-acetamido-3-amino-2,3-dideoxy-glucuronate N-acetyltransferase